MAILRSPLEEEFYIKDREIPKFNEDDMDLFFT